MVTAETIEKARATRALPKEMSLIAIFGMGLLSGLLALSFMLYLVFTQKDIVHQPRPLLVIVAALIITAVAARVLHPLWVDQPYAFPLATTILVLAVLFNLQIALAGAVFLSIVIGVLDGNTLGITATMLLGSATAVFAVRGAERPLTFLLAGVGVAVSTTLTQLAFCWFDPGRECFQEVGTIMLFSGTNGGLSAILSLGLFNLVGNSAGVVTPLRLMELAHPSQMLLRKLIHEAPGTYYHSIAVSNLAEAAADAIGADALLLRVGAYYHDIGKTLRPFFFTDNQMGRENVHNELDPHTSAEIIIDHVRDGIKMARAAKLPEQIVDFISTHHGTHLVGHFYQIALREEDSVNINHFRYPGPRPWTREQGILMLADSIEATVRSKAQHGKLISDQTKKNGSNGSGLQTVDEVVNFIIDDRISSGQLDNTPLTFRDLVLIRQAFVKSLKSIYHPRTEYDRPLIKAQ
jgi:putative nucleotidyltransferase with HDIG domain